MSQVRWQAVPQMRSGCSKTPVTVAVVCCVRQDARDTKLDVGAGFMVVLLLMLFRLLWLMALLGV